MLFHISRDKYTGIHETIVKYFRDFDKKESWKNSFVPPDIV